LTTAQVFIVKLRGRELRKPGKSSLYQCQLVVYRMIKHLIIDHTWNGAGTCTRMKLGGRG